MADEIDVVEDTVVDKRVEEIYAQLLMKQFDDNFNKRFNHLIHEYINSIVPDFDFVKTLTEPDRQGNLAVYYILLGLDYSVITHHSPYWNDDGIEDAVVAVYIHYNDEDEQTTDYCYGRSINEALAWGLLQLMREYVHAKHTQIELPFIN